jgi:hypothetical protein
MCRGRNSPATQYAEEVLAGGRLLPLMQNVRVSPCSPYCAEITVLRGPEAVVDEANAVQHSG